jgi:N-methylhydantoinase B/oxoprolinase/acetone carboxylase alpha subunit
MTDFYDYNLIRDLQAQLAALTETVQALQQQFAQATAAADHRLAVLIEALVEAGHLDAREVAARLEAEAIARRHEVRDEMKDSQSAWDAAAPKP